MKYFGRNEEMQIKAIYCAALIVAVITLSVTSVPVNASNMDSRIESSAKQSYVFKTFLKGDDIKIESKDWRRHLDRDCRRDIQQVIGPGDRSRPPRCQECGQQAGNQRCTPHGKLGCVAHVKK